MVLCLAIIVATYNFNVVSSCQIKNLKINIQVELKNSNRMKKIKYHRSNCRYKEKPAFLVVYCDIK